jgi:hypothetical protein
MKGMCDYHMTPAVIGETTEDGRYTVLRCKECGRERGRKLNRRETAR